MNLKLIFLILSSTVIALSGRAVADNDREQKLAGKWEVVSVDRDGDHRHGEVGERLGDVITINFPQQVAHGKTFIGNNLFQVLPSNELDSQIIEDSGSLIFS